MTGRAERGATLRVAECRQLCELPNDSDRVTSMTWIQTYTGKQFFPGDPRRSDIDIVDIAHALSQQCRFNGHCLRFYSVAEHSVRVSLALPTDLALWGLLHDAAEAYVADLPRPVKARFPAFRDLEDRLLRRVVEKFGLPWPMPKAVHEADTILLATEARDLMAPPPAPWNLGAEPLVEVIEPWSQENAKAAFLAKFEELTA